ncbi:MAG TPA: hypothetical protein VJ717_11525, partial [Gemmatimonadaceae bacterium]|nr:hypothetical protein [Gemmatimonadaceae bacterium]
GIPPSQQRAVRRAVQRGVFVAVSTRTGAGRVGQAFNPDSASRGAMIAAQDLNPQKARILLMLGLAARYDAARIAALFRQP